MENANHKDLALKAIVTDWNKSQVRLVVKPCLQKKNLNASSGETSVEVMSRTAWTTPVTEVTVHLRKSVT